MTPTFIGLVAGLLTSIAALPQVVKTWRSRHARDLSIWQPLLLSFGVALWLIYGMLIGDIPLILANITPLVCNLLLTAMKVKFSDNEPEHNEEAPV
jgi:MtN3 and saliva related transmembrane protein